MDNDFATGYALGSDNSNNNGGLFGGGDGWWGIIILAMLFGWGGYGGGFGRGGYSSDPGLQGLATRADVNDAIAFDGIRNGITGIQQGICDSTYALNNTITNGFHGVDNAICTLGYQTQQGFTNMGMNLMQGQNALATQLSDCCCENRAAIAQVRYDMATQACDTRNLIQTTTRDLMDSQNANTRAILDFLTQDKIAALQAENQTLKFQASQTAQNSYLAALSDAQTAELIRRINPQPVPAYNVPAPYPYCGNSCC